MKLSAITGTQEPEGTDPPAGHLQMTSLVDNLERYALGRFATSAARDAAIPAPTAGMVCFVTPVSGSGQGLQVYVNGSWRSLVAAGGRWAYVYTATISRAGLGDLMTISTIPVPTVPSRLHVRVLGAMGFSGAGAPFGTDLDITVNGATIIPGGPIQGLLVPSGVSRAAMVAMGWYTMTVGSAPTVKVVANPSLNCWFQFAAEVEIVPTP